MKTFLILLLCISQGLIWAQPFSPDDNSPVAVGDRQLNSGLFQEARQTGRQALQQARRSPKDEADIYMLIGRSYAKEEKWDSALMFYTQALQLRRDVMKDPIGTAKTLTSMATAYENQGELHYALGMALEADSILRTRPPDEAIPVQAMLFNNIANIYEELDSLDRAIEFNLKGLALFPITRDTVTKVKGEYGLGKRLMAKKTFENAHLHLDTALMFVGKMTRPDSLVLGQSYELKGAIEMEKEPSNPKKAIEYLEKAKEVYLHFPQAETYLTNVFYNLGAAYESEGMVDSAIVSYNRALEHYNEQSAEPNYLELMETRVESSYNQKGRQEADYKLKLALYSLILALLALLAITLRKNRNERAAAAEKAAAQELLLLKEKENAAKAELLLVKEKENAANAELLLIREKENNRLKDEMFQLRHDIVKNYLQNIDLLISADTKESTADTFTKIKVITNTVLAQIGYANPLGKPAETLKDFALEMHLQAEIAAMTPVLNDTYIDDLPDLPILPAVREHLTAIIQEAFTNIRKYAFEPNTTQRISSIQFEYLYDDGLILTISDQGKGFDIQAAGRSGLRNMEDRAKKIGAVFNIESAPGKGTTLRFTLPNFPAMPATETI